MPPDVTLVPRELRVVAMTRGDVPPAVAESWTRSARFVLCPSSSGETAIFSGCWRPRDLRSSPLRRGCEPKGGLDCFQVGAARPAPARVRLASSAALGTGEVVHRGADTVDAHRRRHRECVADGVLQRPVLATGRARHRPTRPHSPTACGARARSARVLPGRRVGTWSPARRSGAPPGAWPWPYVAPFG